MDRRLKIFLIVCLIAFASAFIVQIGFQYLGARGSVWGGNPGWQREIAFWNVGVAIIVAMTLRLNDGRAAVAVATGCTVLFALLGVNHLFAFVANPAAFFHWPPLALNAVGVVFGARVLWGSVPPRGG